MSGFSIGCKSASLSPLISFKEFAVPKVYPAEFRYLVVREVLGGMSCNAAAEFYDMAASTVVNWVKRWKEDGHIVPDEVGGSTSPLDEHVAFLQDAIEKKPDFTLKEIVFLLLGIGVHTSITSVWRFFDRHGFTNKKKALYAAEQTRPEVVEARRSWERLSKRLDPKRLVFIDETSIDTGMTRTRGWCKRGERLVDHAPLGNRKRLSFIAGLRVDEVTAPWSVDGSFNGENFLEYVEACLVPTLRPNDIVIMDNLPVHKVAGVVEAIEAAKARVVFLPPYSPDLNPIEMFFHKMKSHLRKAAERTTAGLVQSIRRLLKTVTVDECENYLRHAGYEQKRA